MSDLEQLRTTAEVAKALRLSAAKVRALVDSGALDAENFAEDGKRRILRFTDEAIARFRGQVNASGRPTLTLVQNRTVA